MPELPYGCAKPSPGPIYNRESEKELATDHKTGEILMEKARVGKPAPDFELTAFQGDGFRNVRLSDHKGEQVVLCFYPGDFTFV